ncbi:MAG: DMT family transporter [Kiloniellales bacterium]|nr:DMT family transporter [Kiloniellales bacterium]
MSPRSDLRPVFAAAVTGIQVGAAIVATSFVIDQTSPAALAMLRYMIGALCLLPALPMSRPFSFARQDVLPIALLGITQFGILVALLNFGLKYIPAGRAALIFATFPLLTMLLASALGKEAMTRNKVIGVLCSFMGVALVLGDDLLIGSDEGKEWLGALAVFASAFCGAACSVLYRPYLERYPVVPVSAFAMFASVLFLAFLAAGEGFFNAFPQISVGGWAAILFIGLSSGLGYFLWLWALGRSTPTKVTIFLALSPVTAALLSITLLDEDASIMLFCGIASVSAGLWLANR